MFQKEYDDIVMADHSDLGWNTVKQFRGDFGIPDDYSSCGRGTVGSGGSISDGGAIKRGKLAIGSQMFTRAALEATLSLGSVHGSYGVGGLGE